MEYRRRRFFFSFVVLLLLLGLGLALVWTVKNQGWWEKSTRIAQSQPGFYSVIRISDGDTITVNMNGNLEEIRFIGVDTPETHDPRKPVQCYGQEAADYTKKLLVGQKVRLQADSLNTNRDRYNRLLRYVYLADGSLIEAKLIAEGYGFAYTLFPFEKASEFLSYEHLAKQTGRGLWAACQVTETERAKQTNPI